MDRFDVVDFQKRPSPTQSPTSTYDPTHNAKFADLLLLRLQDYDRVSWEERGMYFVRKTLRFGDLFRAMTTLVARKYQFRKDDQHDDARQLEHKLNHIDLVRTVKFQGNDQYQILLTGAVFLPPKVGNVAIPLDCLATITQPLHEALKDSLWKQVPWQVMKEKYPKLVAELEELYRVKNQWKSILLPSLVDGSAPLFETTLPVPSSEGKEVKVFYLQLVDHIVKKPRKAATSTSSLSHHHSHSLNRCEYKALISVAHADAVDRMRSCGLWKA